jgi:hypothetical protein
VLIFSLELGKFSVNYFCFTCTIFMFQWHNLCYDAVTGANNRGRSIFQGYKPHTVMRLLKVTSDKTYTVIY